MKILIAEDSKTQRAILNKILRDIDHDCVYAEDGKQALELFQEYKPDLIILDVQMPEMDGYTLTTAVRNDPNMKGLHIILHTSLSGVFNQNMVQKVGADDFIAKFNPDVLASKVAERVAVASQK